MKKISFFCHKFNQLKSNTKLLWNNINKLLSKNKYKTKEIQGTFLSDANIPINNNYDIANAFNQYFSNLPSKLISNLPTTNCNYKDFLKKASPKSFFISPVSVSEIIQTANTLKKNFSCGYDEIPSLIFIESIPYIANILTDLFNISFSNGIFPNCYKLAKVIPIYKSGDKHLIQNYRPISMLHSASKILEKLMYNRLIKFFSDSNLLNNNQFGFRANSSTSLAILSLYNKITEAIDNKEVAVAVFLDLSKAFDVVNHDILLGKLKHYGLYGKSLAWFESYLRNRKQYVCFNNVNSDICGVYFGIP